MFTRDILYRRDGLQYGEMKLYLVLHYLHLVPQWCINYGERKKDLFILTDSCIYRNLLSPSFKMLIFWALCSLVKLNRPQPAWDRTCTAAAAAGLLWELSSRPELIAFGLEKQAEAVECSLDNLLDALTARRLRLGRSITRKQRHSRNCI